MPHIDIRGLSIRFPVYGSDHRSLKRTITRSVGGVLGRSGAASPPMVTALNNVSLRLEAGDRLGLIGHNGAGKTTLLRTIAGAYAPDAGVVEVEGKVATLLDLMTGMDPFATGIANIRLRGLVLGMSSKEIRARTEEIADFTELGPFLGMPVKTYSAGMVARLAFGITTAIDADVLLMDEWLGVGDAAFRDKAQNRLMGVVQNANILVLASHDFAMVRQMCNKFIGLVGGRSTGMMNIDQLDAYLASADAA
jgi:lipopolysaccharide transport system ATP-binding protein